jgi:Flp pilus assembly protein TadD
MLWFTFIFPAWKSQNNVRLVHVNNRGAALGSLGRNEEAITSYDKSIQIKPDHASAWNSRGAALDKLGRHEEAQNCFNKAKELGLNNNL